MATTLYRIFGAQRRLLYVGITDDYEARMRQHSEKFWWNELRAIETETFADRGEAAAAEACAIVSELPVYNRAGHPDRTKTARKVTPRPNDSGKRNLVSLEDAAAYLGVHTKSIRRYIARGDLPAYRIAGSRLIRIDMRDLDTFVSPLPTAGRI